MKKLSSFVLLIILFVGCSVDLTDSVDFNLLLLDLQDLEVIRTEIHSSAESRKLAMDHLLNQAETALLAGPFTVTFDDLIPPSGDKHDYASMGPYWWPDPNTPDGLPYIRRDGPGLPASQFRIKLK